MPNISAIMALYNTPYNYLKATVESILSQSFRDFELIVIDDASTEDYSGFFEQYNDSRIKYIKLENNAGPGHARNEGIKLALGEFVAIVDSDDVYMPNRFEVQLDFFNENQDISLISGAFKQSNNGKIPAVTELNEDIKISMLFNSPLANPLIMFRKDYFIQHNLFYPENINFGEDYELWIDAMFAGAKIANLNEVLMIYTRRKGQLSKEKSDNQIMILKKIYRKILLNVGIDATQEELDLHHIIYSEKFSADMQGQINDWFDKIIEHNKSTKTFDEKKLVQKKEQILSQCKKNGNQLFRIKIGNNNLCVNKDFKIKIESRS